REGRCYEDYSQSYIRSLSNIAGYQLNRNKLEAEILRLNGENRKFHFLAPVDELNVSLSDAGPHSVEFRVNGNKQRARAAWVVDASGRSKFLARRLGLTRETPTHHGAAFLWVEGLVNIEKLTDLSPRDIRLRRDRAATGHLPVWLATNHFVGEGFWFWVIPLQGKTSLGLVYDHKLVPSELVCTPEKLIAWVCREFPLFARDLPQRTILDYSSYRDFSYDCAQTIGPARWAMTGEAGRFSDPLYSPGGDLISVYNTLITDAILTSDPTELSAKARLYEQAMRAIYEAYVPSFAVSYDALGDQEAFALKYAWELTIYFAFFVFPFINDLFTERRFLHLLLGKLSRLGRLNTDLHTFLSAFYHWKKREGQPPREPVFFDFTEI